MLVSQGGAGDWVRRHQGPGSAWPSSPTRALMGEHWYSGREPTSRPPLLQACVSCIREILPTSIITTTIIFLLRAHSSCTKVEHDGASMESGRPHELSNLMQVLKDGMRITPHGRVARLGPKQGGGAVL